jgi:hypothetical protein
MVGLTRGNDSEYMAMRLYTGGGTQVVGRLGKQIRCLADGGGRQ